MRYKTMTEQIIRRQSFLVKNNDSNTAAGVHVTVLPAKNGGGTAPIAQYTMYMRYMPKRA
jgi:hypothetical protein